MIKEVITCIIIIVVILIGNGVTQSYTKTSIEEMNEKLSNLEETMSNTNDDLEEQKSDIKIKEEDIHKMWKEMFSKLAYYIEHEELEKFSKNLENMITYIKLEDYENATKEIREGTFILNHIEEKYSFNLQNIF